MDFEQPCTIKWRLTPKQAFLYQYYDQQRGTPLRRYLNKESEKDREILEKDGEVSENDWEIPVKDWEIPVKDSRFSVKDREIREKDSKICEKDREILEKDRRSFEKDSRIFEKDRKILEKDSRISEKDGEILEKDSRSFEKDRKILERDSRRFEKDKKILEKDSRISEKDSRISEKDRKILEKDSNFFEKGSRISEEDSEIPEKDSGYRTISNVTSRQVTGTLSGQDSGIVRDMSDFSHGRAFGKALPHAPLSPVKSESMSPPPQAGPKTPKDWRKFFDLVPNAEERKQMELIRRELEQGKLKHHSLPPINYFAEDLPMLPGEAGTRLLQMVRVGEKVQPPGEGRHRIESVPAKLAVHTQNEDAGLSNYGILQMKWTTGVPLVRDRLQPPPRIPLNRSQNMIQADRVKHVVSSEELNLPSIDSALSAHVTWQSSNQFEWEYPLPPPPARMSRIQEPLKRKDHENYCKYYQLVKKKLHLYTSQQRERTQHLPEVIIKRLHEHDQGQGQEGKNGDKQKKMKSPTRTESFSTLLLPPVKLGQLVRICGQ